MRNSMAMRRYDNDAEIGLIDQLRRRRVQLKIPQHELGRRLEVTQAAVGLWESYKAYPRTFARWQMWANALGAKFVVKLEEK